MEFDDGLSDEERAALASRARTWLSPETLAELKREAELRGFKRAIELLRSEDAQAYSVKVEDYLDSSVMADWLEKRGME